jgi:hypothetical protein
VWAALYGRDVIVGGLNISLHELQPRAQPGSTGGTARVRYTPERAILTLMYWSNKCGSGATSDWLRAYDVAGMADGRAAQIAECASP